MDAETSIIEWLALRDLSKREILQQEAVGTVRVEEDASYGNLAGLSALSSSSLPGTVFCAGQTVVLLYISHVTFTARNLERALRKLLPACDESQLRSRAGKHSLIKLFAECGVAFSFDLIEGGVDFVEIFAPTTPTAYQERFYLDPGSFVM
jgi:hypothetical protein